MALRVVSRCSGEEVRRRYGGVDMPVQVVCVEGGAGVAEGRLFAYEMKALLWDQ